MKGRDKIPFFSFGESLGIFGFLLLILCVVLFREVIMPKIIDPQPIDTLALQILEEDPKKVYSKDSNHIIESEDSNFQSFKFNPNTINFDSLRLLGLDSVLAERYLNFRRSFSGFDSVGQIKELYGLDLQLSRKLDSLAEIPVSKRKDFVKKSTQDRFKKTSKSKGYQKKFEEPSFDLNTATYEELISIHGIGDFYADQIIKYRRKLGGFINDSQLLEVYGIDSAVLRKISSSFTLDTTKQELQKLNVNELTEKDLRAHPYCTYVQAEVIVNYRKQHGPFKSIEDVFSTKVFSLKEYQRLKPYLRID